ncbi:MAG TPA: hypothetical protein VIG64_05500 [Actinomycetota bacterium]|jgi:hypothetical protein
MTRSLGLIAPAERDEIVATIHREAEGAGWHTLSNQEKGTLYRDWESRFDLTHAAIKDQIMKGFDAAQHIAPTGEAAVHARVKELLAKAELPYYADKVPLWDGKGFVDFVLGFSSTWITVAAELESAVNWQGGLRQALWYRAAYFQHSGLEVLPGLILFGSVRSPRWEEIKSMCTSTNVLLVTFDLLVDGRLETAKSMEHLLLEGRLRV